MKMSKFSHSSSDHLGDFSTVVELLRLRSSTQPDTDAFTFLLDGEIEKATLTYQELDRRSRRVAAQLQALGLTGERALLLYPPALDFLVAFFGCLYAGVVAVTAYPPRNERNIPRIKAISTDAQAAIALTTTEIISTVRSLMTQKTDVESLQWLTTDNLVLGIEDTWQEPSIDQDTLAFLQYTSGSTGIPKGVMISHGNLIHNAATTYQFMEHSTESKFVSWLPTYHDMGLIGGILQPLYGGFPCILMPPASFLQRPYRWLQAISQYKGTTSGAPNFAYELCTQKITPEQKQTLDLSSWSVAFNGAEPIRYDTLERFAEAFAECGFRKQAFYPCYGMAETTLMVSGVEKLTVPTIKTVAKSALESHRVVESSAQDEDAYHFVSCGRVIPEQEVVIANSETLSSCKVDEIGEIWVSGPSVGQGYWNRPQQTKETFHAYLSDTGNGPFLRTGDLGFLHNGELFITGRAKDLIIIRGRNLYPQDIESTAEHSHPSLRSGAGAAFTVEVNYEERLVIVQELEFRAKPNLEEVISAIRQAVTEEHEIQVYAVVLIKPGSILKTSSGKIQRRATRTQFEKGELNVVASNILKISNIARKESQLQRSELLALSPRECQPLLESYLIELLVGVLAITADDINPQEPLSTLGLDSLKVFELKNRIEVEFEVEVSVADFFAGMSTRSLVTKILAQMTTDGLPSLSLTQHTQQQNTYTSIHPLSFNQQGLWFINQLNPDTPTYNIPIVIQFIGCVNLAVLEDSLNEIIRRHEVLRTSFTVVDGQPVQIINQAVPLTLAVQDLRSLSENERNSTAQRLATELAQQPFDLSVQSLLRAKILQLNDNFYHLIVSFHHIIADGCSIGVFIKELTALYKAFSGGELSPLAELPIQYKDFVNWQQQWLNCESDRIQPLLTYWKQKLSGELPVLNLPTDRPRSSVQTFKGAQAKLILSLNLTKELKKLSRQQGVTLFMTLLTAFKILLYRYTGQTDILVGSPIANRNRAEIESLIGFFVNVLVLRTDLSDDLSFQELLARVKSTALGAYVHQDLPFEKLVEELQPNRDLSYNPLFQVMFVLQNVPKPNLSLSDVSVSYEELYNGTSKFDLTLFMEDSEQGLIATCEYNTDLLNLDTITRMLGHFQTLLESIVRNSQQRISDLPLLTSSELQQLLIEWNNTKTDYPQDKCIHELFEAQVEKTPDAVAVVFEDQKLTYCELNARANQLAHYLQKLGVKPEVLVGICVERTLNMLIGLLAILKAGGAYISLDPTYPKERSEFILEDAQAPVLLTQASLLEVIPQHKTQVVCLDTDYHLIAQQSQENIFSEVTTNNLAYVIYTSGSTGRPKGVMIKHGSTVAMLDWANKTFGVEVKQGILASTSICFDLSVFEIFVPLCCGGKVIFIENALHLPTLAKADNITLINTVPSVISQLLRTDSIPTSVHTVNIAGEPLQNQLVQQLYQQNNIQRVFNLYGPSEDTTYSTFAWIQKGASTTPPIGYPIHNTQTYLLDKNLQLVPVGVPGMLYIGGAGLARGYLNKAELTADKFIPNPYTKQTGERLYKTGDLARYLPNGEIEYIGRIDNQIKLRGFRIELGEIEAVINQHSAVREALVVVHEDSADSKRLVAYIVPQKAQTLVIPELRDFLESKLPSYMIPVAFVTLDSLPLTPNGKVDRKALKAPDTVHLELKETFVEPRTSVEKQLAAIWTEVLGLEKIGINDNFFTLGGDSILSLQVIFKANQLGLNLTTKQLFQYQTIAQLAVVAGTTKKISADQMIVTGLLELTPIQHWFFEQNQPEPHHWNQSVLLESKQNLDPELLEKILESLQKHHDVLRLRFIQEESSTQALITSPDDLIPLTRFDFSALPKDKQAQAIEAAANKLQASLNLSQGPLFRVALFNLGENQPNRLLWIIHHLVVDGVSWRILIEDFQTAYQQISQGKAINLPPKTTSYKQWSSCLQKYAQSSTLLSELDFWLTTQHQLVSPIPRDFPGEHNLEETSSVVSVSLSVEETQTLLQQVPAAYRTQINDVLLTALIQTFNQWMGESSLIIDLEGHGREEIFDDVDLSRTVGWFTTIFPVHLNLENPRDQGTALKSIKEQLRAIPNRGIGYGLLRYLNRDQGISEQFSLSKAEVIFNYLGQFDQLLPESSLFNLVQETTGSTRSLRSKRTHLLEINSGIYQGNLEVNWSYSNKVHRQTTIEVLAQNFIKALRSLIAHCQSQDTGSFTPSDFAEFKQSQWDQTDLDAITAAMGDM
ncbi:MAG: non-ribosomal peptide synthetase [Hapalosiphonaceae cyanobacterium JJU2]|nr:MAG: non-ribosomal peptide synthetase [Hapalosiphonaceae cyanobacterium JJU2]